MPDVMIMLLLLLLLLLLWLPHAIHPSPLPTLPPTTNHQPPTTYQPTNRQEVDIGLAADLGTLTRVPRITGNDSLLRELCYTGRNFSAADAQALGLLSRVLPTPDETLAAAEALAVEIAGGWERGGGD
jgi:hypothetical protein